MSYNWNWNWSSNRVKKAKGSVRSTFVPGQRVKGTTATGGPGQTGVSNAIQGQLINARQAQPSWYYESDTEYFGHAAPSYKPVVAGGVVGGPFGRDAFRTLGDLHGGRA